MQTVRIICRQSRLSLLQAELVKQRILAVRPGIEVEIKGRSSRGDRELLVPLASLDGTDFFTEEIFKALQNGEADIAVHSLKDMSAPHFFSHTAFAVADRDDTRDIVFFNPDITDKLSAGKSIVIGTCSPRREQMAVEFLKMALPQQAAAIDIRTEGIRGNVEGRLQQLREGKYDGTILATAGLNRLLRQPDSAALVQSLLKDLPWMLLPLVECVPAPCQGAIVAEADPANTAAVALLKEINIDSLLQDCIREKRAAWQYGTGCLQKFGVTSLQTPQGSVLYAAGEDESGRYFSQWDGLPDATAFAGNLFRSTQYMKDFFTYQWLDAPIQTDLPAVFVANYKSLQQPGIGQLLHNKTIWASGTKTWTQLAKLGYWVQGSADALGFENLLPALKMPLIQLMPADICIITHTAAARRWQKKGYAAVSNYSLSSTNNKSVISALEAADNIFWSSFAQFEHYGRFAKSAAVHCCAGGETASLLRQQGIEPIIFPTIKAFEQWSQSAIPSHSAA